MKGRLLPWQVVAVAALSFSVVIGVMTLPAFDQPREWNDSWVFDQTWDGTSYNATFWGGIGPTIHVVWSYEPYSQTYFPFYTIMLEESQLESALEHPMRVDDNTLIFIMHESYDIPNYMTMDDAYRILFHDGAQWVMNRDPIIATTFPESRIEMLVEKITEIFGGVPMWGVAS